MRKQTAVEWLVEQLNPTISIRLSDTYIKELKEKAKAMEKEQIIKAYEEGYDEGLQIITKYEGAQEYYTSTFGQ